VAHYRKPLAAAVALNTAIFVPEAIAGFKAGSLSLIMEVFTTFRRVGARVSVSGICSAQGLSRNLVRSANLFSSVGLIAVSGC